MSPLCCKPSSLVSCGPHYCCRECGRRSPGRIYSMPYGGGGGHRPGSTRLRYSRIRRFSRILSNVFAHRCPTVDNRLMKLICEADLQGPAEVFRHIRSLEARWAKRYDACAYLCVNVLNHKIPPLCRDDMAYCLGRFRMVETLHRYHGGSFPAYSWIAERLLFHVNRGDLVPYIHRLKCRRRRKTYTHRYERVLVGGAIPEDIICRPWAAGGKRVCNRPGRTQPGAGRRSNASGTRQAGPKPAGDPTTQLLSIAATELERRSRTRSESGGNSAEFELTD